MTRQRTRTKVGPLGQRILLLLMGGLCLSLTRKPDVYFRIVKEMTKEWQEINRKSLQKAIRNLYRSKIIECHENPDGTYSMVLTDKGKKKALRYNLEKVKISRSFRWDGQWRIIAFDIPESQKAGRNALTAKLKNLGFYPLQKSIFVFPYECKNEIDFISEIFNIAPYVRYMRVNYIDNELDLKQHFDLLP